MKTMKGADLVKYLEDEEIISLYWARDEVAITETDRKYGKYLYTIAYNLVRDTMDCEECLNDTYLATWNKIPPARPTVFQVFLSKIMRNIAIDRFRKNTAAKRVPPELTYSLDELDDCISFRTEKEADEFTKQLSACFSSFLRGLSRRDAVIFICRYYYSDTVETIAGMFNVSESTIFRTLSRLRRQLREVLESEVYGGEA